jgi:norsolorinic acid ketoreductase
LPQRILTTSLPVSGASRGIGLQLVYNLLERQPDAVIFAGARDPTSAKELNEFASKHRNVHVIKLIADDEESNKQAVEEIKKITDRLDVVVANAGKSDY